MNQPPLPCPETERLAEDARRDRNWKRWGPYLSERQWGTVREDYSADGSNWTSFPYEHSRARAYRWGEDGLLGFTDRECRLCFALALWNGVDSHLKERLFGLTNPEGNHGEDVKEVYFYLDATPTSSYLKALYKYPQGAFPYDELRTVNRERTKADPEYELVETGVFDEHRYWDVTAEYAKAGPDDTCVRLSFANRGPDAATLTVLPTAWFRNTWSWGAAYDEGKWAKPSLTLKGGHLAADHETLGPFRLEVEAAPERWLFTENETDPALYTDPGAVLGRTDSARGGPYKDAFHRVVVDGDARATRATAGTKAAGVYTLTVEAGATATLKLRLRSEAVAALVPPPSAVSVPGGPFADFDRVFADRVDEAERFYAGKIPAQATPREALISRQAYAGLLWSNQFYHYVVPDWIAGDSKRPNPEAVVKSRINKDWRHLFSRDILSTPDKWEYPAFFAWDTAFHMIPMARIDPAFAKHQLLLLLREWYLHPNGQMPAYEYDLSNVTPPVHAWACWQVYEIDGKRDLAFLERAFHKLTMNFTWWVNRKDPAGNGVFSGGFLGMDNLGPFDRSRPLPGDATLEQADGTAWMGFYCTSMLRIALELAGHNRAYEDIASKFYEHFIAIADALNTVGGHGLFDEADGFYYDQLRAGDEVTPLKLRGMVGMVPLFAVLILEEAAIHGKLPAFVKRMEWFMANRKPVLKFIACLAEDGEAGSRRRLLALPSRERLTRVLKYLLDESEFLSPFGIRSLSKVYRRRPYSITTGGQTFEVRYAPADMDNSDFGGNSNWRGPVWLQMNFLLIGALNQYHRYFGDDLKVECPTGSGVTMNLSEVANELERRLDGLFGPQPGRPAAEAGPYAKFAEDPHWRDCLMFFEYFDGDTGRGLGASHQTGWTALVATMIADDAAHRAF